MTAKSTWQLVAWLTHAQNAVRHDADLAAGATSTVLGAFTGALMRHEERTAQPLPEVRILQIAFVVQARTGDDPPYITVCGNCEWTEPQVEAANEWAPMSSRLSPSLLKLPDG